MSQTQAAEPAPREFEFEAMNLQVGGRIQFITHRSIKPVQHFSTLIGWVKDEYMIVKTPLEHGAPIPLSMGDKLTIRVFSGVNVCSFAATVERIFDRPINYLHLSFPTSIQGTSLRTAMRVKVDIPAEITPEAGQAAPIQVDMVNLSVSGALMETPRKLPFGAETVRVAFTLLQQPGNHQVRVDTRAKVKNVSSTPGPLGIGEMYSYGVQFLDLEPVHYTLLQNITYEALIADRQKIV